MIEKVISKLNRLERIILPLITKEKTLKELIKESKLKEVEVMRAIQWLQNKKLVLIKEEIKELIILGENGKKYLQQGLPEKRFLKAIEKHEEKLGLIAKKTGLTKEEQNICIGILKKKTEIELKKEKELIIKITNQGKKSLEKKSLEEKFLEKVFPIELNALKPEEKFSYDNLIKRKNILTLEEIKVRKVNITKEGKKVQEKGVGKANHIDRLTPLMIKNKTWKNKKFRSYDVEAKVPTIGRGKRHFVNQAINSSKRIWLEMGFKEMVGKKLQTSFWNFDSLFTAQDHPARDMHDTFFIKNPSTGKLPPKELIEKIKQTHENGWTTGSKGWGYEWKEEKAKTNVLRTHTTCLSAKTISNLKLTDLPVKYFTIGKCFRNETMDWSHLFEFNQNEGIVIDENANFRNLLGYLKKFFRKMGYKKARFRPAYFPYTEFSIEVDVFHPKHKEWFELGGAGIFRPEVVKPLLGKEVPILAWGPGFDRIILEFYKIDDIRNLYKNDLKQLKEIKEWMR
jgi:phenylalanyl-tRNA synthetase alpha chain